MNKRTKDIYLCQSDEVSLNTYLNALKFQP